MMNLVKVFLVAGLCTVLSGCCGNQRKAEVDHLKAEVESLKAQIGNLVTEQDTNNNSINQKFEMLSADLAALKKNSESSKVQSNGGNSALLSPDVLYMEIGEIQSDVAKAGGARARVQFGLLINFEGTDEDQQNAIAALSIESKPLIIASEAAKLMKSYDLSAAQDANFTDQYAFALMRQLNTMLSTTKHKIKVIRVHPFRIIS